MLNTTHTKHHRQHKQARSPLKITTHPHTQSHLSEERDLQINYGLLLLHHGKCESVRDTLTIIHQTDDSSKRFRPTRQKYGRPAPQPPPPPPNDNSDNSRASHTHTKRRDAAEEVARRPPSAPKLQEKKKGGNCARERLQTQNRRGEREIDRRGARLHAGPTPIPSSSPDESGGRENTLVAMIELAANTE